MFLNVLGVGLIHPPTPTNLSFKLDIHDEQGTRKVSQDSSSLPVFATEELHVFSKSGETDLVCLELPTPRCTDRLAGSLSFQLLTVRQLVLKAD